LGRKGREKGREREGRERRRGERGEEGKGKLRHGFWGRWTPLLQPMA